MAYIKKKSKEYNPTEATAHMRTKKKVLDKEKTKERYSRYSKRSY